MNRRQLLAVLMCGMFLVPAPVIVAADTTPVERSSAQDSDSVPDSSGTTEDGVYDPQYEDSKVDFMEYAGLAVVDSDGTILNKSTIGPGERLRVEVTSPSSGTPYHLLANGTDESLDTASDVTNGRFGYEVLVFEVSYEELNKHREQFPDGLTIYIGHKLTSAVTDWSEKTYPVDHFELEDEDATSGNNAGDGTTDDSGTDTRGDSPLDGTTNDNPVGDIIDTLWGGNPFTSGTSTSPDSGQETTERGGDWGSIFDNFDLPTGPFLSGSGEDEPQPTYEKLRDAGANELTVDLRPQDTPVDVGDDLALEAEITNEGEEAVTDEVHLLVGLATHLDKQAITLDPGESTTVRFEQDLPTFREDHELTFTARTVNGGMDEEQVQVYGDAEAASNSDELVNGTYAEPPLYLEGTPGYMPSEPGENITAGSMAVETETAVSTTVQARLYVNGRLVDTSLLDIPKRGHEQIDVNYTIPEDREQEMHVRVEVGENISREYIKRIDTSDESGSSTEGSETELTLLTDEYGLRPVNVGSPISVEVALHNRGDEQLTRDVEMLLNETEQVDAETVTLDPGENRTVTLSYEKVLVRDQDIPVRIDAGDNSVSITAHVLGHENMMPGAYDDGETAGEGTDGPSESGVENVEFNGCKEVIVDGTFGNNDTIVPVFEYYAHDGKTHGWNPVYSDFSIVTEWTNIEPPFTGTMRFTRLDRSEFSQLRSFDEENGEIIERSPDSGLNGSAYPGVYIGPYTADGPEVDIDPNSPPENSEYWVENPNNCRDEIQPERPNITVDAVRTDVLRDNTYEVEFTVENPNEGDLTVDGEFISGTTEDSAPQTLEPGENTFRVRWTPESDDEQLVFEGGLESYGYDEPITAETEPASEYGSESNADNNTTGSGDGSEGDLNGAQDARFEGCKYVEVDGEFGEDHTIIPTITWYSELGDSPQAHGEYGILGENIENTPFNGTITFQIVSQENAPANAGGDDSISMEQTDDEITYTIVEDDSTHGLGILGVTSGTETVETMPGAEYTFQTPNDCFAATQPDRPTATLDSVEPTGDGTYTVTVTAENPNDANMTLRGGFVGSTTDADVEGDGSYVLEPGENTYTATWEPESPDDRLRFTGDLSGYDYDDPLAVETDPASEYGTDSSPSTTERPESESPDNGTDTQPQPDSETEGPTITDSEPPADGTESSAEPQDEQQNDTRPASGPETESSNGNTSPDEVDTAGMLDETEGIDSVPPGTADNAAPAGADSEADEGQENSTSPDEPATTPPPAGEDDTDGPTTDNESENSTEDAETDTETTNGTEDGSVSDSEPEPSTPPTPSDDGSLNDSGDNASAGS